MNISHGKKWLLVLFLCSVLGITYCFIQEPSRKLSSQIFFIQQQSYYAFSEAESKTIYLDGYIGKNSAQPLPPVNLLCHDASLVLDNGTAIPVNDLKWSNNYIFSKGAPSPISNIEIAADISSFKDGRIVAINYINSKQQKVTQRLGMIDFETVHGTSQKAQITPLRISWESTIQPAFVKAQYSITNTSIIDLMLTKIHYGASNVTVNKPLFAIIKPNETKEITCPVDIPLSDDSIPLVYYLKPLFYFVANGVRETAVSACVSKEKYHPHDFDLYKYAYYITTDQ